MKLLTVTTFALLLTTLSAFAGREGEWGSSGGGEFFRDQHNPWFVKNVTTVRYCVDVDTAGFSATSAKAIELTQKAISYWRKEFADRGSLLGLATQDFLFNAGGCRGDEDLRFQFGHGTLSAEQIKLFTAQNEDPQDYVGIALRTNYDKVNLRGRGFIFISSDQGNKPYNRGEGITKQLWSHDGLLYRIIQHELGHVFGIAHTERGLMAADFPESMVRNYRNYRTVGESAFFSPPEKYTKCALQANPGLCAYLETKDNWASFELKWVGLKGQQLGIEKSIKTSRLTSRIHFPVKIFLPKEQTVFPRLEGEQTLKGPGRVEFRLAAQVESSEGKESSLLLDLRPDEVEIFRATENGIKLWP